MARRADSCGGDNTPVPKAGAPARSQTVRLALVDGRALCGDANLVAAGGPGNTCESTPICGTDKFLCVAESSTINKLNQSYAEIRQILVDALLDYDTNVAPPAVVDFSPIAPLARCP